jgi:hypothetical protein
MNLFRNLHNLISSLNKNIFIHMYIEYYIYSNRYTHELIHKQIIMFEFDLFNSQAKT